MKTVSIKSGQLSLTPKQTSTVYLSEPKSSDAGKASPEQSPRHLPIVFFWTAFTAIYLLLRQEVDQAELDEVYLTPQDETYGLPPLETDEAGVQGVADLVQKDKNPDREDA